MQPDSGWVLQPLADMSTTEFDNWCRLLEERSGIVWQPERKTYLEVRLTARMRELGISNYDRYYRQVLTGARGALEWSRLLDRLTVQETRFFRHPPSFELVGEYLQERLAGGQEILTLWSVGCATGEEAWSLAMLAAEAVRNHGGTAGFSVLATDISRTALATAREGGYPARALADIDESWRARYVPADEQGRHRISSALGRRVCFSRINILELAQMPVIGMDLIFCQNVLIYFRRWQRRDILNQLAARLRPGGVLVLGVGEITGWTHPQLMRVDNDRVLAFVRKGS